MRSVLLALALLPGAAAMGRYVPEGCMETPGGRVIQKFDGLCVSPNPIVLAYSDTCTDDNQYLQDCYDYCIELGGEQRPAVDYMWAEIGFNTGLCDSGAEVPCYCAQDCPEVVGTSGMIAGPCPSTIIRDGDGELRDPGTDP